MPVKPLTKDLSPALQMSGVGILYDLIWLQWNTESKTWLVNHKPLPQWFIDTSGTIPPSFF